MVVQNDKGTTTFGSVKITPKKWELITFVGTDRQNIKVYLNDVEAGNVELLQIVVVPIIRIPWRDNRLCSGDYNW